MLHTQTVAPRVEDFNLAVQAVPSIEAFPAMTGQSLLAEREACVVAFVQDTWGRA